jgi:uncharacterized protein YkwD
MGAQRTIIHRLATAAASVAAALAVTLGTVVVAGAPTGTAQAAIDDQDWLGIVNAYRAMSGLSPVVENPSWSLEGAAHAGYMLLNGMSHDEIPGKPGYTPGGDVAGNNGNVAVSSGIGATPRNHIDLWMTGPFHAIGILRSNLTAVGFGMATNPDTSPWKSGATLDVLRGLDWGRPRPTSPIVFPGRNATVPLHRFVAETPNPVTLVGWSGSAGLPLIAMMPNQVSTARATLTGPAGPMEVRLLYPGKAGGDWTAQAIMAADNAVVVVPRSPLADGRWTATVESDGGSVTWSFTVDTGAGLSTPRTLVPTTTAVATASRYQPVTPYRFGDSRTSTNLVRLRAGVPQRITVADRSVTAISANFTVDRVGGAGFITAYNCGNAVPQVSTLNFAQGAVANQAIVPLDKGALCVYSPTATDLIIDVNGELRPDATAGFVPVTPGRVLDSRRGQRLAAGEVRTVQVTGVPGGAPAGAVAVAVNLTAIQPDAAGHLQAYPGSVTQRPQVSNVNFAPGEVRPNSAIVPVGPDGTIQLRATTGLHVLVDVTGYFVDGGGAAFTPLNPIRLFDSRSLYGELNGLTGGAKVRANQTVRIPVAGTRGIPRTATAVSVNITAVEPSGPGHVTAYPGGTVPTASTLNVMPGTWAVANGALIQLDANGVLHVRPTTAVHLIVDVNGVWN